MFARDTNDADHRPLPRGCVLARVKLLLAFSAVVMIPRPRNVPCQQHSQWRLPWMSGNWREAWKNTKRRGLLVAGDWLQANARSWRIRLSKHPESTPPSFGNLRAQPLPTASKAARLALSLKNPATLIFYLGTCGNVRALRVV